MTIESLNKIIRRIARIFICGIIKEQIYDRIILCNMEISGIAANSSVSSAPILYWSILVLISLIPRINSLISSEIVLRL